MPCQQPQGKDGQEESNNEPVNMNALQVALGDRITAFHALHNNISNKHMDQLTRGTRGF
ncbi:hypothetical protein BDQ17DRAFT_1437418 [Cyathus striatus]|nr:hypothetical protein BDQ17DRAFT_1437418 [Cyathus striatus]